MHRSTTSAAATLRAALGGPKTQNRARPPNAVARTTTTTTVCGVRARPLAPPPVQVPPLPTTVPAGADAVRAPPGVPPGRQRRRRAAPLLPAPRRAAHMLPLKSMPGQPGTRRSSRCTGRGGRPLTLTRLRPGCLMRTATPTPAASPCRGRRRSGGGRRSRRGPPVPVSPRKRRAGRGP